MAPSSTVESGNSVRLPASSGLRVLQPVPIYDVTKLPDERSQQLQSLLQKGHVTVAPLRDPELILHSHLPHVCSTLSALRCFNCMCMIKLTSHRQLLGSAYALGADSRQLANLYEHEITQLVPIDRGFIRGGVFNNNNWRDFFTCKECIAYATRLYIGPYFV